MKSEVDKTVTKVVNGVVFLSNHCDKDQYAVWLKTAEQLETRGMVSLAGAVRAAANHVGLRLSI